MGAACKEGGAEGEGDEVGAVLAAAVERRERRAAGETGAAAPGGTGTAAAVGGAAAVRGGAAVGGAATVGGAAAAVGCDAAAASATGVADETATPDRATGITFSFPGRRGQGRETLHRPSRPAPTARGVARGLAAPFSDLPPRAGGEFYDASRRGSLGRPR